MKTPEELYAHATSILEKAYVPYSNFPVACVVQYKDGTVIEGVNIENVSFGATNCAERTALFTGVTRGYTKEDVDTIVITGAMDFVLSPCSICRQVMVELCRKDTPVYLSDNKGNLVKTSVEELVPFAFDSLV